MTDKSLKGKMTEFFEVCHQRFPGRWIHKGELEIRAKEAGYLADNCTRRLREMENDGVIEHRLVNGSGEYRLNTEMNVYQIAKLRGWKVQGVIDIEGNIIHV